MKPIIAGNQQHDISHTADDIKPIIAGNYILAIAGKIIPFLKKIRCL
jgi:hypothetical protein